MEDGRLHCALPCESASNTVQAIVEAHRGLGNPTEVWLAAGAHVRACAPVASVSGRHFQSRTQCRPLPIESLLARHQRPAAEHLVLATAIQAVDQQDSDTRQAIGSIARRAKRYMLVVQRHMARKGCSGLPNHPNQQLVAAAR